LPTVARATRPRRKAAEAARPHRRPRRPRRRAGYDRDGAFARLGWLLATRPGWVLAATAAAVAVAVVWGAGVFGALSPGGFEDPSSGSARAQRLVEQRFPGSEPDLVLLYESSRWSVNDRPFRTAVERQLGGLDDDLVRGAASYWSTGSPGMVSEDRHETFVQLALRGEDDDGKALAYEGLRDELRGPADGIELRVGGDVAVFSDVTEQSQKDIERAERLTLPVTLVLLVCVFGGLVAAGLPLLVGAVSILGALTVVRLLTTLTDVSVFAVNIIVMLGLGLSIDYALLVVTRYREERAVAGDVPEALVRTLATAGRTVAFSGATVSISLASLLLFPQPFLRSMGLGGMAAVLVAVVSALTVLPAVISLLGCRVDSLRVVRPRPQARHRRELLGRWHRLALGVMRRPVAVAVLVASALLVMGSPFLGVSFGSADHKALPDSAGSRVVAERLAAEFPSASGRPVEVVVTSDDGSAPRGAAVREYASELAGLPGVTAAEVRDTARDAARIDVRMSYGDQSSEARRVVEAVRDVRPPDGTEVVVGGPTAQLDDLLTSLARTVPLMLAVMVLVTLVFLFLAFGSVVLSVKAVVLNVLSLSASFGLIVLVFQEGHFAGPLGVSATGTVDPTTPLLMLAVVFGLSMDYEVFLLSRIREEWDRTQDNTYAVAAGLQHTGRIITSAAALFVVVIAAFSTSDVLFIKLLGLGMMTAVVIDATLVRMLLVPATMQLLGRANWWAPAPLARLWQRHGLRHG
jgi:RND superfamily putative drug exporter